VGRAEGSDRLTGRLPAVDQVTPKWLRLAVAASAAKHGGFLVALIAEKTAIVPDDARRPGTGRLRYYASKADHPDQRLLIEPEPNLTALRDWVKEKLAAGPKRWQVLTDELREELWLEKHLNEMIRDMRKDGDLNAEGFTGKFAQTNDPLLSVRPTQTTLF
jgi:hypothetical protein